MSQPAKSSVVKIALCALCTIVSLTFALTEIKQRSTRAEAAVPQPSAQAVTDSSQFSHVKNASLTTAVDGKPFAFGYLEFDWDPSAPGGVPGFDKWPG